MLGLLKGVATDLAKYKSNFSVLEVFRLYRVGTEWAEDFFPPL